MHPRRLIQLADAMHLTRWSDGRPRVPILLYHMIVRAGEQADPAMAVSQPRFDQQLAALTEAGYACVSLDRLVAYVRDEQPVPARSFVLTFDDGFLSTYRLAWPVLRRYGMTATVFLVSDRVGAQSEWMRVEPSGPQLLMGPAQIREMQCGGIDFASHGRTHAHLTQLNDAALVDELAGSRRRLAALIGREVRTLGYPHGEWDARVRSAAERAGYTAAVSVVAGWNRPGTDLLALRRLVVTGRDTPHALLLKMILGEHRLCWHGMGRKLAQMIWRRATKPLAP